MLIGVNLMVSIEFEVFGVNYDKDRRFFIVILLVFVEMGD